jgi:hypothetical protein
MGYLAMTQTTLAGRDADRHYDQFSPLGALSGDLSPAALGIVGVGIFAALVAYLVMK